MRACAAILKDSFREALVSRVLWILLLLTTLLLALAAPLALTEQKATRLARNAVRNWVEFTTTLGNQAGAAEPSPARHVISRLPVELRERLALRAREPQTEFPPDLPGAVISAFNDLLADRDLYDEPAFREAELTREARGLIEGGVSQLADEELARLNRLLIEAAWPSEIISGPSSEMFVSWFGWKIGEALPFTKVQVEPLLKTVLAAIMNFFVGTLGVFAAILVTATIIPHTFEAGAVDLLLSKPVSRVVLFLTRFFGGCAFILLNAAYFVVGLWLIAGLRFDLWSHRLLWCIPLFLFLFAVYYSISALAGVLWRNAIVSVVLTVLFWAACFVVGTAKNVIEQVWLAPARFSKLVPAGETLFAVTELGQVKEWHAAESTWEDAFQAQQAAPRAGPFALPAPLVGPFYDSRAQRLLAVQAPPARGRFSLFAPAATLSTGSRADGWTRKPGPTLPAGDPLPLVTADGEILAVTAAGIFALRESEGGAKFERLGPEPAQRLRTPFAAAVNNQSKEIVVYQRGTVLLFARNADGRYALARESRIEGAAEETLALVACEGQTLLVALADGRMVVLDPADLSVRREFRPVGDNAPRTAIAAPGGRWFAVLFHHHRVWLYDAQSQKPVRAPGGSKVSAAAFDGPGHLLVADRGTRVTRWSLDPRQVDERRQAPLGTLEQVYYYAILPFYTIFPRPDELENVVTWLSTGQQTVAIGPAAGDLAQSRVAIDIAGPIWSSVAFLTVVLGGTCLYIARADF